MYCTSCGKSLDKDARFCMYCGASVAGWATQGMPPVGSDPTQAIGENERADGMTQSMYVSEDASQPVNTSGVSSWQQQGRVPETPTQAMPYANSATYQRPTPERPAGAGWGGAGAAGQQRGAYYGYTGNGAAAQAEVSSKGPVIALVVAAALVAIAAVVVLLVIRPFDVVVEHGSSGAAAPAAQTEQKQDASSAAAPNILPQSSKSSSAAAATTTNSRESAYSDSSRKESSSSAAKASDDYVLPDSNSRYYSKSELQKMGLYDLYIARNEIYARHGRGFKNKDLREYFAKKSWYKERYSPEQFDKMASPLNDYEQKNSELMRKVESERNSPYL